MEVEQVSYEGLVSLVLDWKWQNCEEGVLALSF